MDGLTDMAYAQARESFEAHRGKIIDAAVDAHDRGDEEEAQRLLEESRKLVYTGLNWQADNGINDPC
jgi:hypothetical protein